MAITAAALVFFVPYNPKELWFLAYNIANLWSRSDSRFRKSTEKAANEFRPKL
jgi:hypothetical protein